MQEWVAHRTPIEVFEVYGQGIEPTEVTIESNPKHAASARRGWSLALSVALALAGVLGLGSGLFLRYHYANMAVQQAQYTRNLDYFQDTVAALEKKVALLSDEVEARQQIYRRMISILEDHGTDIPVTERQDFVRFVYHEAMKNNLDPILAMAVIKVESSFETTVVSPMGAIGLMQVIPLVGRYKARELGLAWKGEKSLMDPYVNVRIGLSYLMELANRFSDFSLALEAYNRGPGALKDTLISGVQPSTHFAQRVLGYYNRFRRS